MPYHRAPRAGVQALAQCTQLHTVDFSAFSSYGGTLDISGEYPVLEEIPHSALWEAGGEGSGSKIQFTGLPKLRAVRQYAFYSFRGTLDISGAYPLLRTVPPSSPSLALPQK